MTALGTPVITNTLLKAIALSAVLAHAGAATAAEITVWTTRAVDEWIRDGRIVAKTRTEILRSGIGVEVRAGSPRPDIRTIDLFKRALLNAKSVAFLKVGSGVHLERGVARLRISEAIAAKTIRRNTDIVSELVAKWACLRAPCGRVDL